MAVSGSRSGRMAELQLTKLWRDQQREISPERTKVWTEPPNGKSKLDHRVPVVYYLSRNGQLEHPHFMEVPLSSSQGLFLRDVISRLNVLRGKGMAAMYSWSCKRSYKNGFVWHDLSENDFIYPAHGHEYVLKGSELLEHTLLDTVTSLQRQQPRLLPPPETQITGGDLDYPRILIGGGATSPAAPSTSTSRSTTSTRPSPPADPPPPPTPPPRQTTADAADADHLRK
ncbi:hypothetical protein Pfo_018184 [Paulownia fortunei]|nr:hypothetical protein Pfo_018184 [Paulownia fortunei]